MRLVIDPKVVITGDVYWKILEKRNNIVLWPSKQSKQMLIYFVRMHYKCYFI